MRVLHELTEEGWSEYRSELTGDKLGWLIFKSDRTFVPVHRILMHPEDGPVLMIGHEVLEVDPEAVDAVYPTEDAARDAYYARREER
jgi:hypothetical protein